MIPRKKGSQQEGQSGRLTLTIASQENDKPTCLAVPMLLSLLSLC